MKISKKVIITSTLIFLGLAMIVMTQNRSRLSLTESAQTEEALIAQGEQLSENLVATSASEAQPELSEVDRVLAATDETEGAVIVNITPTAKPTSATKIRTQQYTFFYGAACPHCTNVEGWFEDEQIGTKLNILKKEVYQDPDNSKQLTLAAQSCGIDPNRVGVPFLYTPDKECIMGDTPIIEYLAEKAGMAVE